MTDLPEHQSNIHDFPWLVEDLANAGTPINGLGCVMLPVRFLKGLLSDGYRSGALSEDDLYTAEDPANFWIKGDVTAKAHVTLLYGLLTPAFQQEDVILRLFEEGGFIAPSWLPIDGFELFPSNLPNEPYSCLVARIGDPDGRLALAHSLLEYLPHVNTFAEWKLHATIAYLKQDAAQKWIDYLSENPGLMVVVPPEPIDMGSSH